MVVNAEVRLSIDRLVVEGYSHADARRVSDSFAERLTQLAAARPHGLDGLTNAGGAPTIPALDVPAGRSPGNVGRAAAEALWGALVR